MRVLPLLLLIWMLVGQPVLRASELPQYTARHWQIEEGLPHNSVYSILQSREGYLFIGTDHGLVRFDGVQFRTLDLQKTSDARQSVRSLLQTRDGRLWAATDAGEIACFREGTLVDPKLQLNSAVRCFFENQDGVLWVGTTNGLARCQDKKIDWITKKEKLPNDSILSIGEDRRRNLWIGTSQGLACHTNGTIVSYEGQPGAPIGAVRALFFDKEDALWIGSSSGLTRLKNNTFTHFGKTEGFPDGIIRTIFEDSRGQLWVGTMGGLCRRLGEKFVVESNNERDTYETIFCITEDREGSVWLGTKEGLSQLQFKPFQSYTRQHGLAHNNVMSVLEDRHRVLWVASWGGGLSKLRDGEFITYNSANSRVNDALLSLCESRDGSLWTGADFDGGLFRWNDEAFSHFEKNHGLIDSAARVIYEDLQTNLWIGTSGALYLMKDGKTRRFTTADGLAGNTIRAIHQDREGSLWIGTDGGLSRMQPGQFKIHTVAEISYPVLSLHEDKAEDMWIGTDGGGLCRISKDEFRRTNSENSKLETRNLKFTSYTSKDGLFSDTIFAILEDDLGNLWMSCFSGVFQVRKKDLDEFEQGKGQSIRCVSYGKKDGMASIQCNGVSKPAGWKGADGRLWFPTTRGVTVVDPKSIREIDFPPPVALDEIVFDKNPVFGLRSNPSQNHTTSELILQPGRGELEFHYTTLSFRSPEKNRFKYKLEGIDSDWVEADTRRIAYYNNIRPGKYQFLMKGSNSDGVWNEAGASITIKLLPHFWQTNWFIALVTLIAVVFVAAAARYVTWKRVRIRLRHLEQQHVLERERARIAADMHDDLGSQLTEIKLLGELALSRNRDSEIKSDISRILNVSREVVRNLDTIVWSVNPRNDTLDHLVSYMIEQTERFLSVRSIAYTIDAPAEFPNHPLSSEVRHNLYLVVKEAVNNIVKHSEASAVLLRIRLEESTFSICIEDNGKGFSTTENSSSGNGLQNMARRMKTVGGSLAITSEPKKGTKMRLEMPLSDR